MDDLAKFKADLEWMSTAELRSVLGFIESLEEREKVKGGEHAAEQKKGGEL